MIDVHSHMHSEEFKKDIEVVLKRAENEGLKKIISAGLDLEDSIKCMKLSKKFEIIRPVIGLAPYSNLSQINSVLDLIRKTQGDIIGIGEIGLDYPWEKKPEQVEPFRKQIQLAKELNLPVSVHSRSAGKYVLDILEEERIEKVHLHSFGGSKKDIRRIVDLGYFVSITCRVILSEKIQTLVRTLPLELILIETDSPVLGVGEGRNEPAHLRESMEFIAALLELESKKFEKLTEKNAKHIFGRI